MVARGFNYLGHLSLFGCSGELATQGLSYCSFSLDAANIVMLTVPRAVIDGLFPELNCLMKRKRVAIEIIIGNAILLL